MDIRQSPFLKKGQAVLEMALLGTLVLFIFSALLVYGQRLDLRQQLKMEAFRKAIQRAYYDNSAVSYTIKRDTHIPNLFSGYGNGQYASTQASATVMWQKGMGGDQGEDDEQNFSYYELNDKVIDLRQLWKDSGEPDKEVTGPTGEEYTVPVLPSVWKEEAVRASDYDSSFEKNQDKDTLIVTTKRSADLNETVTTKLYTRYDMANYDAISRPDDQPLPDYAYEGQTYTRTWTILDSGFAGGGTKTGCTCAGTITCYVNDGESEKVGACDGSEGAVTKRTCSTGSWSCSKSWTMSEGIDPVTQGAYLENNRISFSGDSVGTNIHKERTWTNNE